MKKLFVAVVAMLVFLSVSLTGNTLVQAKDGGVCITVSRAVAYMGKTEVLTDSIIYELNPNGTFRHIKVKQNKSSFWGLFFSAPEKADITIQPDGKSAVIETHWKSSFELTLGGSFMLLGLDADIGEIEFKSFYTTYELKSNGRIIQETFVD